MRLEGNNGGDVLEIESLNDGRLHLKVGHCCVYEIDHIVPVEFLTSVLTNVVIDAGGIVDAIRAVNWPNDYTEELASQIEPYQAVRRRINTGGV